MWLEAADVRTLREWVCQGGLPLGSSLPVSIEEFLAHQTLVDVNTAALRTLRDRLASLPGRYATVDGLSTAT